MSYLYYGVIVLYPLVAAVVAKLTISEISGWFKAIKEAYYLFFGFFLVYAAIVFFFLGLVQVFLPPIVSFITFTIGYAAIFVFRTYVYVERHDMFKKPNAT